MSNARLEFKEGSALKGVTPELITMHDMIVQTMECISLIQNAFIYNRPKPLDECGRQVKDMLAKGAELVQDTAELHSGDAAWKPYVLIPHHILSIAQGIEKLSRLIRKKVDEKILFSDKAVNESTYLLQRLTELLAPTADIVLARNIFLCMYIQESQASVSTMALQYATLHEERLIRGACNDLASPVYIGMLDALKDIAWHSREIAVKLAGK